MSSLNATNIRAPTPLEALARLKPVRSRQDPEATVTAGNASGENDAAAVCIVASPEAAARHGLEPLAVFRSWAAAGVHPEASALIQRFDVEYCVVDAATAFRERHRGTVYLADYVVNRWPAEWTDGVRPSGRSASKARQMYRVVVDRTAAMDEFVRWLRNEDVVFPRDAASIPGLFAHLQAPVRTVATGANGHVRAVYQEGSRPDDYFHAGVYALLAWQRRDRGGAPFWADENWYPDAAGPVFKGIWNRVF